MVARCTVLAAGAGGRAAIVGGTGPKRMAGGGTPAPRAAGPGILACTAVANRVAGGATAAGLTAGGCGAAGFFCADGAAGARLGGAPRLQKIGGGFISACSMLTCGRALITRTVENDAPIVKGDGAISLPDALRRPG